MRDVVICSQHAQENAFSETARTDKEKVAGLLFQQGQIGGLVHIILVLLHYFHEVRNAIRYSFHILHN